MARERAANKPETTPPIIMNCLANISRVTLTSFTQKPAALSWEIFPTCSKLARSTYRGHVWSFCSDNWVLQEIHQVLSFHIYTSVGCNRLAHQDLNQQSGRHEPTVKLWTKGPSSEGSWFTKAGMFRHFSVNEAPLAQTSSCEVWESVPGKKHLVDLRILRVSVQGAVMFRVKRNSKGNEDSISLKILSAAKSNWKHTLQMANSYTVLAHGWNSETPCWECCWDHPNTIDELRHGSWSKTAAGTLLVVSQKRQRKHSK